MMTSAPCSQRILFLTQVLPYPLDAGPKTRAYYVLRRLADRHKITLLSFVRPTDSPEALRELASMCADVYTVPIQRSRLQDAGHLAHSLTHKMPFLIERDWAPDMAEQVRRLVRERAFDVVHADQLWMAPYALLAQELAPGKRPRLVLDQHNAVFQIPRRLAQGEKNPIKRRLLELEARKLAVYERDVCQKFDHVVWVTEQDRAAMEGDRGRKAEGRQRREETGRSSIIPICVDPEARPVVQRKPDAFRVTFLGGLHWPPNAAGALWFSREVWPTVRAHAPEAILTIIGKDPPSGLTRQQAALEGVETPGYVADLEPYLRETAVFIVPLHAGGGMRVKILDAWSWGLPVVSTRIGAEGLEAHNGDDALLAEGAEEFAMAVIGLLRDACLNERLAAAGRRRVEQSYNWRVVYDKWDDVYVTAPLSLVGD